MKKTESGVRLGVSGGGEEDKQKHFKRSEHGGNGKRYRTREGQRGNKRRKAT